MFEKAHKISLIGLCAFLVCSCKGRTEDKTAIEPPLIIEEIVDEEGEIEHRLVKVENKAPSFYEDGCSEHYKCLDCGKIFDMEKNEISKESVIKRLPLFDTLDQKDPIRLFGKDIKITYSKTEFDNLITESNAMINKIKTKYYSASEANEMIKKINNMLTFLSEQYDIAYVLADANVTTEDYDLKNEIYSAYYELTDQYYATYVAIAKEGSYNHLFFKNKTQEQINQYILDHSPSEGGGSSTKTTSQKIETLLNEYKGGKIERYQALHDYVELAKQLATEKSYPDYLDYAYSQNNREYTVENAIDLSSYVTTYLTPIASTIDSKLNEYESNESVKAEYTGIDKDFFGKRIDLLREYSQILGNKYKANFQSFFEGGHYFFSDVENPNVTAYTATNQTFGRMIFMSGKYQSLMTFVHEFGHYNAGEVFGGSNSLDLSETQSIGNELMLLSHMNRKNDIDQDVKKAFTYQQLFDHLNDILLSFAINELEEFIYTKSFDKTALESKWEELLKKYGAVIKRDKFDYMYQVLLNYRGYYISYGVAGIAALQLFAKSMNNFENSISSYTSIFTKESNNERFKKSLENAGLFDVFNEDAFRTIDESLKKI